MFFCEAGNRSIDQGEQRIRIILCSVKLRVLNPKLHKQRYIREIKKRHIKDKARKHHRECLLLLARKWSFRHPRRCALSSSSFRVSVLVVVYFVAGVRPVDAGIFLLSCLLFAFRDCLSSSSSSVVVCVRDREKLYPF